MKSRTGCAWNWAATAGFTILGQTGRLADLSNNKIMIITWHPPPSQKNLAWMPEHRIPPVTTTPSTVQLQFLDELNATSQPISQNLISKSISLISYVNVRHGLYANCYSNYKCEMIIGILADIISWEMSDVCIDRWCSIIWIKNDGIHL